MKVPLASHVSRSHQTQSKVHVFLEHSSLISIICKQVTRELHNYCFSLTQRRTTNNFSRLYRRTQTHNTSPVAVIKLSKAVRNCACLLNARIHIRVRVQIIYICKHTVHAHEPHYSVNSQKLSSHSAVTQSHYCHYNICCVRKRSPVAVFSLGSAPNRE